MRQPASGVRSAFMIRTRLRWLAVSMAALSLLIAWRATAQQDFTTSERRRLRAGELVQRPHTERRGTHIYIGGSSWQRVNARRSEVWREIEDTRNYTHLIPGVDRARLVERRGDQRVVYLRHRYSFVSVSYYAIVDIDRTNHTMRFRLDPSRPHDIRDGRGFLTVHPYRRRHSIVTWGVRADVGNALIRNVFGSVLQDWILKVPFCVRAHVEDGDEVC